jgi:OOP family OmpA-OmpF porin
VEEPAPAPQAQRIVLRGVQFDLDKADIRPDAGVILDEAANQLSQAPGTGVSVEGHTDSSGSDAYNQSLSERRAASVRDYLVGKGVEGGRLSTAGYGESQPVADNATAEGRALNRRVELKVKE